MKKIISLLLVLALAAGVFSVAMAADHANDANGSFSVAASTSEIAEDGQFSVTVTLTPSADVYITTYTFALTYDNALAQPKMDAEGAYSTKSKGVTTYYGANVSGMKLTSNFNANPFADSGKNYFLASDANNDGFNVDDEGNATTDPISVTFFFQGTPDVIANGGDVVFELAVGTTSTGTALFTVGTYITDDALVFNLNDTVTTKVSFPKPPITVAIDDIADQEFTGSAIEPAITVKNTATNAVLALNTDYTVTYANNTNVGEATVTIAAAGGNVFTAESVLTKTFKIVPTIVDVTWSNTSFTYDGTAKVPTATASGEEQTVTVTDGPAIDVGTYNAKAETVSGDYSLSAGTATTTFTIAKADHAKMSVDVTVSSKGGEKEFELPGLTEADGFKDVVVTAAPAGIVTGFSANGAVVKLTTGEQTEGTTDALTVTVSSKNFGDFDYKLNLTAKNVEANWTTEPAAATDLTYGVMNRDAVASFGAAEVKDPEGNPVSVVYRAADSAVVQNAGKQTVTVEVYSEDYGVVLTKVLDIEIAKAPVTVTWTGAEFDYDGAAHVPTAVIDTIGVNGETLAVEVTGEQTKTGNFTATAALTVTDGNANADNYALDPATFAFSIVGTKVRFEVTLDPAEFDEDGTDKFPATVTVKAFKESDGTEVAVTKDVDYTVELPAEAKNVGTYEVKVVSKEGADVTGTGSATYVIKGAPTYVADSLKLTDGHTALTANYQFEANGYALTYEISVWEIVTKEDGTTDEIAVEGPFTTDKTSYTVSGLKAKSTYKVSVTATNNRTPEPQSATSGFAQINLTEYIPPVDPVVPAEPSYTVTLSAAKDGKVTVDKTKAKAGETVKITVTADEGFELEKLTVTSNGAEIALDGKDNEYSFVMPKANATVTATFKAVETEQPDPVETKTGFVDVPADAWYAEAVAWAVENEITTGVGDNRFAPMAETTRGEVVTFLWRVAGKPAASITSVPFTDVDANAYYYEAMLWAYETGLTTGTTETTFEPAKLITRAEMVTFLYRQADAEAVEAENPFNDVEAGSWYEDAVLWAVAEKVTAGTGEGTFEPGRFCSRAETVTFLYNNK